MILKNYSNSKSPICRKNLKSSVINISQLCLETFSKTSNFIFVYNYLRYRVEATELRRVIELGKTSGSGVIGASNGVENNFHGSLEEATELEYLRNIMFEYMMGRQPAVSVQCNQYVFFNNMLKMCLFFTCRHFPKL